MKDFTTIPNSMLNESQLSIPARYLYCVLFRYCGQKEWCYPGQITLADILNCSPRYVRTLLDELYRAGVVTKKRKGFNKSNNYKVAKELVTFRNNGSPHLGSKFPIQEGTVTPPKNTYVKAKDKRNFEKFRKGLTERGIIK